MTAKRYVLSGDSYTDGQDRYGHRCDCGFRNISGYAQHEPTQLIKLSYCPDCGEAFIASKRERLSAAAPPENPIVQLWEMRKEMERIAKTVKREDCGYPDALEFLLDDLYKLRGRLMQVGAKGQHLYG